MQVDFKYCVLSTNVTMFYDVETVLNYTNIINTTILIYNNDDISRLTCRVCGVR